MFRKFIIAIGLIVAVLVIVYYSGPTPEFEPIDNEPTTLNISLEELDNHIAAKEAKVSNIKPDNHSEIIWADSIRKTEYSIVYLHGYSASKGEGDPIHRNLAKKYGVNLYLPRLFMHGLNDDDAFMKLTPKGLIESAKEAIAIGKILGDKVILMSTSTGGTLSVYLAANDPMISSLILLAPNIDIADPNSHLINDPWGKEILRAIAGSDYRTWEASDEAKQYWTTKNRIEGLVVLRELLDHSMTDETFSKITIPTCVIAYYKNEEEQDNVVSVAAMDAFVSKIATTDDKKKFVKLANAGTHPLGSKFMNENWMEVQMEIDGFLEDVVINVQKEESM